MTRTAYKIFKYIYKNRSNQSLSNLSKHFNKFSYSTIQDAFNELVKNDLVVNKNGSIELTLKGNDYFFNLFIKIFRYIFTCVLVPILVAFITTRLTIDNKPSSEITDYNCCDYSQYCHE